MKLLILFTLIFCLSALSAQTLIKHPLFKQAFQISYEVDFDKNVKELIYFSYKKHIRNNNAHKIGLNVFYDLNKYEDLKRQTENTRLNNGFSLSYSLLHYSQIGNDLNFYYGIGLMGKYSYQEDKENEFYGLDDWGTTTTDFQIKWSPNFFPCFGFEFAFAKNFSLNLENSLFIGYSSEILKTRYANSHGDSILSGNKRIEDYYFKPVNVNIGIYYYF